MIAVSVSSRCRHTGSSPVCVQRRAHERREVAGLELAGGEVDGDRQRALRVTRPAASRSASLMASSRTSRTERHDEAAVLGDGDERGRGQDRAVVIGDPASASKPATLPLGQVDDGLVVHDDPVVIERRLQHPLPVRPLLNLTAEGGVEDLGTPPTERLRPVHGLVGLVEQDLRRPSSADRDGNPDARRDRVTVFGPVRAAAQLGDDSSADVDRVQVALDVGCEDDELVAADAGDGVHRAQDRVQLGGDPAQHRVSCGVPAGVVDLLEPVEVDEEHGSAPTRTLRVGEGLVDAVDEQRPIRQPGQRVVRRLLGQRRLGVLQVGHPLGLGPAEPIDLTILRLLGAEVGEREADEVVAVDRRAASSRPGPETATPSLSTRSNSIVVPSPSGPRISSNPIGRPPATNFASRDPTTDSRGHDSSSAKRRLA